MTMTVKGEKYKKLVGDLNRRTPFNSPILVIQKHGLKRDETVKKRLMIDFTKLNSVDVKSGSRASM